MGVRSAMLSGDNLGAAQQVASELGIQEVRADVLPADKAEAVTALRQGGANLAQRADPQFDTADFGDAGNDAPGNLRADYVLPSKDLQVCASGIFWPTPDDPMWRLVNDDVRASSDHRLVWIDVALPGFTCPRPGR